MLASADSFIVVYCIYVDIYIYDCSNIFNVEVFQMVRGGCVASLHSISRGVNATRCLTGSVSRGDSFS